MADNFSGANIATRQGEGAANIMQWGQTDKALNQVYQEQKIREAQGYNEYQRGQQLLQKELGGVRSADMPIIADLYAKQKQLKQQLLFNPPKDINKLNELNKQATLAQLAVQQGINQSKQLLENDKQINQMKFTHHDLFDHDPNSPNYIGNHTADMQKTYIQRANEGKIDATPYLYSGTNLPKLQQAIEKAKGTPQEFEMSSTPSATGEYNIVTKGKRYNSPNQVANSVYNAAATINGGSQLAATQLNAISPQEMDNYVSRFKAIPDAEFSKFGAGADKKQLLNDLYSPDKTKAYAAYVGIQHAVNNPPFITGTENKENPDIRRSLNWEEKLALNKIRDEQTMKHIRYAKEVTGNDPLIPIKNLTDAIKTGDPNIISQHLQPFAIHNTTGSKGDLIGINPETSVEKLPNGNVAIHYTTKENLGQGIYRGKTKTLEINPNDANMTSKIASFNTELLGKNVTTDKKVQSLLNVPAPKQKTLTWAERQKQKK